VKVGVGKSDVTVDRTAYVLARFAAADRSAIDQAIATATAHVLAAVAEDEARAH
jgi:peptidyl-tRNA hydrolase